jgi:hypothetical protein
MPSWQCCWEGLFPIWTVWKIPGRDTFYDKPLLATRETVKLMLTNLFKNWAYTDQTLLVFLEDFGIVRVILGVLENKTANKDQKQQKYAIFDVTIDS